MSHVDESQVTKVAERIRESGGAHQGGSMLLAAAAAYGASPRSEDATIPTGFDPQAGALFEALVEAAFLVANADGDFDATERDAFQRVVLNACRGAVLAPRLEALLADLQDQLDEDGLEKRIAMIGRAVLKAPQQYEVLRIAGLLAHISGDVSAVERGVLDALASSFGLEEGAVAHALDEVRAVLA